MNLTRDAVINGLARLIAEWPDVWPSVWEAKNVLRATVALLTPPTTAEIDAARDYVRGICMLAKTDAALVGLAAGNPSLAAEHEAAAKSISTTLDRALDALARVPELEAQRTFLDRECAAHVREKNARIAALEAQVRESAQAFTGAKNLACTASETITQLTLRLARVQTLLDPGGGQSPSHDLCAGCRAAVSQALVGPPQQQE